MTGKTLLVVGAASELAIRLAEEAARRGASVALAALHASERPAASVVLKTPHALPHDNAGARHSGRSGQVRSQPFDQDLPISWIPVDALDEVDCEFAIESAVEKLSRLDAVIATIPARSVGALESLSITQWEERVVAPLRCALFLARRVLWEFLSQGRGGRLVFVTDSEEPGDAEDSTGTHGSSSSQETVGSDDIGHLEGSAGSDEFRGSEASAGSGRSRSSGESDTSRIGDPNEIVAAALVSLGRSIAKEAAGRAVACNVVVSRSGSASTSSRARIVDAALYLASEESSFVNGECVEVMSRLSGERLR